MARWLTGLVLAISLLMGGVHPTTGQIQEATLPLPKPSAITAEQRDIADKYGTRMIDDQCAAQPLAMWCLRIHRRGRSLDAWTILDISLSAKDKFTYLADVKDEWRVHSAAVLDDRSWNGDCDDLTSTTLDLLLRAGLPANRAWFVLVNSANALVFDHLIAMVQDDHGKYWIVGDTSSQSAYPVSRLTYRVVAVASTLTPRDWRDPRPLRVFPEKTLQPL